MSKQSIRILLVMHNIPLDSGFLGAKFIKLAEKLDVHLLTWDKKNNIDRFIEQYKLPADFRKRIHLGADTKRTAFYSLWAFLKAFLTNKKLRRFLFFDGSVFKKRLKFSFSFLPAICLVPDVIHFEFGTLAKHALMLKEVSDAKLSSSFRGYDLNYAGLDDKEYYATVWQLLDGVHFLGQDLKQRAIQRGYREKTLEAIIPPAIDTKVFNPSGKVKVNDRLIIISSGRLVWKKGYEYGIRAVKLLKDKGIPFEYHILGDGVHKQAIQFVISELQLEDEVKLHGSLTPSQIKEQLDKAHVFLHPAISEGFSNAVLEAQAMGLPVICSDADGLHENIEDSVTGFITPKWDVDAIAEKLALVWNNKKFADQMGVNGIKRVNAYFRQEEQIKAFVEFYEKLAAAN